MDAMNFNPYETLGLGKKCSKKEIDKAYRNLSKKHHPDMGGNADEFSKINLAAQILRDDARRKLYDEKGLYFDVSDNIIRQNVIGKFSDIIGEWMQTELGSGRQIPIKEFILGNVRKRMMEVNKQKSTIDSYIEALKNRKKQITVDNGEDNLIHKIMDQQIIDFKNRIVELEQDLYVTGLLKDLASKYSSEEIISNGYIMYGTNSTATWRGL